MFNLKFFWEQINNKNSSFFYGLQIFYSIKSWQNGSNIGESLSQCFQVFLLIVSLSFSLCRVLACSCSIFCQLWQYSYCIVKVYLLVLVQPFLLMFSLPSNLSSNVSYFMFFVSSASDDKRQIGFIYSGFSKMLTQLTTEYQHINFNQMNYITTNFSGRSMYVFCLVHQSWSKDLRGSTGDFKSKSLV